MTNGRRLWLLIESSWGPVLLAAALGALVVWRRKLLLPADAPEACAFSLFILLLFLAAWTYELAARWKLARESFLVGRLLASEQERSAAMAWAGGTSVAEHVWLGDRLQKSRLGAVLKNAASLRGQTVSPALHDLVEPVEKFLRAGRSTLITCNEVAIAMGVLGTFYGIVVSLRAQDQNAFSPAVLVHGISLAVTSTLVGILTCIVGYLLLGMRERRTRLFVDQLSDLAVRHLVPNTPVKTDPATTLDKAQLVEIVGKVSAAATGAVQAALGSLSDGVLAKLDEILKPREEAVAEIQEAAGKLSKVAGRLEHADTTVDDTAQAMSTNIKALANLLRQLEQAAADTKRQVQLVQEERQSLAQGSRDAELAKLQQTTASLKGLADTIVQSAGAVAKNVGQVSADTVAGIKAINATLATVDRSVGRVEDAVKKLQPPPGPPPTPPSPARKRPPPRRFPWFGSNQADEDRNP